MPTTRIHWVIHREGRRWTPEEAEYRSCYVIPDRPEIHHGKLYFTDSERLAVVACLLENLGIDQVVQSLGSPDLWQAAVATLKTETPPSVSATLSDLADQAAMTFANLDREVDGYFEILRKLDPELAERAEARAGGPSLAALLLLCPSPELGGKSALQLWVTGARQKVQKLLAGD